MLKVTWTTSHGWSAPEIVPSGPIGLHPFSHVFHYAIEVRHAKQMDAHSNQGEKTNVMRAFHLLTWRRTA